MGRKFELLRVPVGVEYNKPIIGRIYGLYCWIKCIRFFKFKLHKKNYYCLAIPKYEVE